MTRFPLVLVLALSLMFAWPSHQTTFPKTAYQANWGKTGSCTYAASAGLAKFFGSDSGAKYIHDHYSGAAWAPDAERALQSAGLKTERTKNVETLKRWSNEGRPFVVGINLPSRAVPYASRGAHAVVVFYFDSQRVGIYDSNHASAPPIRFVQTSDFLKDWQHWAVTIKPSFWSM